MKGVASHEEIICCIIGSDIYVDAITEYWWH